MDLSLSLSLSLIIPSQMLLSLSCKETLKYEYIILFGLMLLTPCFSIILAISNLSLRVLPSTVQGKCSASLLYKIWAYNGWFMELPIPYKDYCKASKPPKNSSHNPYNTIKFWYIPGCTPFSHTDMQRNRGKESLDMYEGVHYR